MDMLTPAASAARDALRDAYNAGELIPGSTTHDAIGTIVFKATGNRNLSWWPILVNYSMNQEFTPEEEKEAKELVESTGFNLDQLLILEAAFEGGEIDPLDGRICEDSVASRLVRTIRVLNEISIVELLEMA